MFRRQTGVFHTEAHVDEQSQRLSEARSTQVAAGTVPTMTFMFRFELAYQLHGTFRLESKR